MCAMIPMLRVRASGYSRRTSCLPAPLACRRTCAVSATVSSSSSSFLAGVLTPSPPVVGERLVGLSHLVDVLAALHRAALPVRRVHDLADQPLGHRVLAALPRVVHQPADGERGPPGPLDLDRDLVRRPPDPPGTHLEQRPGVVDGSLQRDHRVVRGALGDDLERLVDDPLGQRLLTVLQHLVDQLGDDRVLVDRVGPDLTLVGRSLARHRSALSLGAVLGPGLAPVADARRVEGGADDLVADAREVLHPAAADQHDRVLLQVVPDAGDVGGDLGPGGQAYSGDLAQRGVGLLRGGRVDARADAPPLRRAPKRGALGLRPRRGATLPDELLDGWHACPVTVLTWFVRFPVGLSKNRTRLGPAFEVPRSSAAFPWVPPGGWGLGAAEFGPARNQRDYRTDQEPVNRSHYAFGPVRTRG